MSAIPQPLRQDVDRALVDIGHLIMAVTKFAYEKPDHSWLNMANAAKTSTVFLRATLLPESAGLPAPPMPPELQGLCEEGSNSADDYLSANMPGTADLLRRLVSALRRQYGEQG